MFIEICLAILTATLIALFFILFRIFSQVKQVIPVLQKDVHDLSTETILLINALNEFVRTDLHVFSKDTSQLIGNLSDLSSDIKSKSHSLNFLFKPLSFLSSKVGGDLPSGESASKFEAIPEILKWVASTALLFKTSREVIKNYAKRT